MPVPASSIRLLAGNVKYSSTGSKETGWVVLSQSPGQEDSHYFVVQEDGAFRVVADDRDGLRMLRHYYVRPDVQVAQLRALGYPEVEVYGMEGQRISEEQISGARGWWLHYLCRSA